MIEGQPPTNKTGNLVFKMSDPRFRHIAHRRVDEYHEDLITIVQEQQFLLTFARLEIVMSKPIEAKTHLLELCQFVYPRQIHELRHNNEERYRSCYHITIAKLLYDAYHLDYVLSQGEGVCHIDAHDTLSQLDIEPMLAHVLVRTMCSVSLTYGREQAQDRYGECLYQAAEAYRTQQEEWDRIEQANAVALLAEQEEQFSGRYGTYEDLEDDENSEGYE